MRTTKRMPQMRCVSGSIPGAPDYLGGARDTREVSSVYPWNRPRENTKVPHREYQVAKAKNEFSASMWDNKAKTGRQTLCKACCQQQNDAVHKCDACQVLLLGPRITSKGLGIRVRYPRGTRGIVPGRGTKVPRRYPGVT